ncbi:MAG TPA: hypothetical protein VNL69_12530 [Bacteroidota bacterium]|nr:hypothetical protein [Bacteroidota bacterium]
MTLFHRKRTWLKVRAWCLGLLICCSPAYSRDSSASMAFYEVFFRELMLNSSRLARYHEPKELEAARRLGIEYEGEPNKFMIGYGFEESARRFLRDEGLRYTLTAESLDEGYTMLNVEIPQLGLTKRFFFRSQQLVSPVQYHTRSWIVRLGRYVEFRVSDTTLLHPAAIEALDRFVEEMMDVLACSDNDRKTLQDKKIIYFLCRDESEIEKLTGFRSRGMYLIPYDYIVSTYPCHYHEVAHLLLNFKLRRLPLFTHPFLQEGFATAYGGRGGIAARTLLHSGAFLASSSAVNYRELFLAEKFREYDPSLAYAVAGLYVRFLTETFGMDRFLELYRRYSGTADQVQRIMLHAADLPPDAQWEGYARRFAELRDDGSLHADILVEAPPCSPSRTLVSGKNISIVECGAYVRIRTRQSFALMPLRSHMLYRSRTADELGLGDEIRHARFYVHADSHEVVLYDLFTECSLASYSRGFALDRKEVPRVDGYYEFWIRRELLPARLNEFKIIINGRSSGEK